MEHTINVHIEKLPERVYLIPWWPARREPIVKSDRRKRIESDSVIKPGDKLEEAELVRLVHARRSERTIEIADLNGLLAKSKNWLSIDAMDKVIRQRAGGKRMR